MASPSAVRVASNKKTGFLTLTALLIRWPDMPQGQQLLRGYPIVAEISLSGVFRSIPAGPT